MCGLGTIIIKENKNKNLYKSKLLNMSNLISHRGPDQAGFLEYENILLSHLRLPVMDPRNLGRQPMSVDNRYSIIFNGEIFNYKEIKRKLIERKYKFYSNSDTEVALNAFIEWGEECFNLFNGDWIICILDKLQRTFLIAKDGLGTKPIYFYEDKNIIALCSELKGITAIESLEFDENKIGLSPLTLYGQNNTQFKNITQIEPGFIWKFNLNNFQIEKKLWFNPLQHLVEIHPSYEKNKQDLFTRLFDAVKLRLDADLKIGLSLSGGLDSSILFSILNEIDYNDKFEKDISLNPTILDYDGNLSLDEAIKLCDLYEREYKVEHSKFEINTENLSSLLSQLEITEEYNKQFDLYASQKSQGIDVSIAGLGPDEYLGIPGFFPQLSFSYYNNIADLNLVNQKLKLEENIKIMRNFFGDLVDISKKASVDFSNFISYENMLSEYIETNKTQNYQNSNHFIKMYSSELKEFNVDFQYTFFKTQCGFLQWMLHTWDKASMANSVEIRAPFLDKNVYLYLLSLPLEKKIKGGVLKSILKDSFEHIVPNYVHNENYKQGLPISRNLNQNVKIFELAQDIVNQTSFANYCWNKKKIYEDMQNKKNMQKIWHICKLYLMDFGFKTRLKNLNEEKYQFEEVPTLEEKLIS